MLILFCDIPHLWCIMVLLNEYGSIIAVEGEKRKMDLRFMKNCAIMAVIEIMGVGF